MSEWVIVAIPSEQDYVWKLSSEKKPHMTLLFLGEQEGNPHEVDIASFIKHAVDTTLDRFGMDVDRRGTLGPDMADVLFFNKTGYGYGGAENMEAFRNVLLQDQNIFEAHSSTAQYDSWTPHLTLGYPTAPAHPDERDYPGTSWVSFDKIALWTSDSEGYEFLLKEQELAMSDISISELAHHGVPGMKWGKHKVSQLQNNHQLNKASRANDKVVAKKAVEANNKSIDEARGRLASGATHKAFKDAKSQFKSDKLSLGTREARKVLDKARATKMSDISKANEIKPGREYWTNALSQIALETIAGR